MVTDDHELLSRVFGALSNDHRRAIVHELSLQPHSISYLAKRTGLSLPAIHRHVRVLEEAAMVRRRKIGRTNFLSLERVPLQRLAAWVGGFHPWWGTDGESLINYASHLTRNPEMAAEPS